MSEGEREGVGDLQWRQCEYSADGAQVLFATGDLVAQQLIEKKGKDHDLERTG